MNLKFTVDQQAALRQGIDAPQSTVVLNVDPATLTRAERNLLADWLHEGYDLTKWVKLPAPTLDGLKSALQAELTRDDRGNR